MKVCRITKRAQRTFFPGSGPKPANKMGIVTALFRARPARAAILLACALMQAAAPAWGADTTWTAIIARGFPGDVFTWHLKADGSYREDGREIATGASIQPTLTGRWTVFGDHMVLRQDGIDYVFDGVIGGDAYQGLLYLDGKPFARFCAVRGDNPPPDCDMSV